MAHEREGRKKVCLCERESEVGGRETGAKDIHVFATYTHGII